MAEYEYGVLSKPRGTDFNWTPVTGYRKTTDAYRTLGPAKGYKTYLENRDRRNLYDFKLVKRKINEWEDIK